MAKRGGVSETTESTWELLYPERLLMHEKGHFPSNCRSPCPSNAEAPCSSNGIETFLSVPRVRPMYGSSMHPILMLGPRVRPMEGAVKGCRNVSPHVCFSPIQ